MADADGSTFFMGEEFKLGFVLRELMKNAIVHGHKLNLELPVYIQWRLDRKNKTFHIRALNSIETDDQWIAGISADRLREQMKMSGEGAGENTIHHMTSGNLPVRKTIQDTITVSELEISVIPRSEARQSLLNHPMRGPKIRKMILSFYKRTAPRMTKDQLAEKINRRFFSDDISEEYFAVTAIEIKQYRNAAAVQYAVEPSAEEKGAYYLPCGGKKI